MNDVALLLRLWRVADRSHAHVDSMLQDLIETTRPQFLVLRTIASTAGVCTQQHVSRALACSRANVNQVVRLLRRAGLVYEGALVLTPRGRNAFELCEQQFPIDAGLVFGALDENEKAQLLAILEKVREL